MRKFKLLTLGSLMLIGASAVAVAGPHMGYGSGQMDGRGGCQMMDGSGYHQNMMNDGYGRHHRNNMMNDGYRNHMGHADCGFGMFYGVDLTEQQQKQLNDIANKYRGSFKDNRAMRSEMRNDVFNMITADEFAEAKAKEVIEKRHSANVDNRVLGLKMQNEMFQVLTPEQKAKVKSHHESRMKFMDQRQEYYNSLNK